MQGAVMARPTFRIFVSSPGDVTAAREVAAQVIEKVAHDYARFLTLEPYLWEYEPMLASGHFEDSIDPPSRFDAVILILGSRLGTPLPERTAVREYRGIDGRTPVTGTEWEFEDALASARANGLPDLLVYRSSSKAEIDTWNVQSRKASLAQIDALDVFWSRHFADGVSFIGGYTRFKNLDELAAKFEGDLRRCLSRRVESLNPAERTAVSRVWLNAPFRGLETYEFEHSAIFFGRDEAIRAALLRLVTNAEEGCAFLLVLGASGSGKSSLVKAGIVPRLLIPQRVSGSCFLRRAIFRPSDALRGEDLFDALARCLTESNKTANLPELLGPSTPLSALAQHLRESSRHPDLPFVMVLDRLAQQACEQGRMLRFERAKLILVIDQFEEIFTLERVSPEERQHFIELVVALARSGRIWIVATMRADFWHQRAGEAPQLVEIAEGKGRLDLLLPTPAELSQMIRRPADAAAIEFETHVTTGIPLNDLIGQAAAREPGALPLLSYLLDQLYEKDIQKDGGHVLTYASYSELGGLKGAIATCADAVLRAQPPEVRQSLPTLLFALVQMSADDASIERAVARRAPLSDFPAGSPSRRLVDALLDPSARLLVVDAMGDKPATVRLAHEALISEWQSARDFVAGNTEILKIRRMLEERQVRWQIIAGERKTLGRFAERAARLRSPFHGEPGLLTEVDLADAKKILRDHRDDLAPSLIAYINRSIEQDRRRRRRTLRAISAVAAVMSILAIGALYEGRIATAQRNSAIQSQLRSLTEIAAGRVKDADVAGATAIVLEVLDRHGSTHAYTEPELSVFQEARAFDTQITAISEHLDRVPSARFSPDGRRIVSASYDRTARIWDSATGHQIMVLRGHTGTVHWATFSPDGRLVATASFDKTARIWDAATGAQLVQLSADPGRQVWMANFSPDGNQVVTASSDKTARLWDAKSGQQIRVFTHPDTVYSAAFSADGKRIVTAGDENTARIWDALTGKVLVSLVGHTNRVLSAQFAPDGRHVITSSDDQTARIWDAATGQQSLVLNGHTSFVASAVFSSEGGKVVTTSDDKTARIWNATTGQMIAILRHSDQVWYAEFSADDSRIVTAAYDKTVRVWDVTPGPQIRQIAGHTARVQAAVYSPDGQRIATASYDNTARICDAASGNLIATLVGHNNVVLSVRFSPDGRHVITASADKTARIWDAASGQQLVEFKGHTASLTAAAFSPDGRRVVTGSNDKTVRIWDAASGEQLKLLSGHGNWVAAASYSPDGRSIASASYDRTVRIWNAETGQADRVLAGHTASVYSVAFSPDGRRLISGSADNTVRIWDVETGQQLSLLSGHGEVGSASYSPDGRRIVTGDNHARVWDAASGEQVLLMGGYWDIEMAAFSPDGTRIITAGDDNITRIWDSTAAPLALQISWAKAAQLDPLLPAQRAQIGLPAATTERQWSTASSKCDASAAAYYDPDRVAPGLSLDQIVADIAAVNCQAGDSHSAHYGQTIYQHGRAMLSKNDLAAAKLDFQTAAASGYRAAEFDLAMLYSQSSDSADLSQAIAWYEKAWKAGVNMAAFQLGTLYERGNVPNANAASAWSWYRKGADAAEPHALARFGEHFNAAALTETSREKRGALLLQAFGYYAAASERARAEDWPDDAWKGWRYHRASLARVLAHEGMMPQVAASYEAAVQAHPHQ
jgi:WD40 repeat protein/TPR repeat protein